MADQGYIEVPPRPTTEAEFAALPVLEFAEEINEHLYVPGDVFCSQCGVHLAEAATKPCGRR